MALPTVFFEDVFNSYPKGWKIYGQHAFKIAILYKNTTKKDRSMLEIRSGQDGKTELKNGKPPIWKPNEEKWIAIEPSNQTFYYKEKHVGAAAYPKSIEDAKTQWKPISTKDILKTVLLLKKHKLVIPVYQIADTLKSLFELSDSIETICESLKKGIKNGLPDLGFPGKIEIFTSPIQVIGHPVTERFIKRQSYFPMSYRKVPIEKGALLILDMDHGKLKKGPIKYTHMDFNTDHLVEINEAMMRIIDAPQVKGALWLPLQKEISYKLIEQAKKNLTNKQNYSIIVNE